MITVSSLPSPRPTHVPATLWDYAHLILATVALEVRLNIYFSKYQPTGLVFLQVKAIFIPRLGLTVV